MLQFRPIRPLLFALLSASLVQIDAHLWWIEAKYPLQVIQTGIRSLLGLECARLAAFSALTKVLQCETHTERRLTSRYMLPTGSLRLPWQSLLDAHIIDNIDSINNRSAVRARSIEHY